MLGGCCRQSCHGDLRCLFPTCFSPLCLLYSYMFPLVLNMHFAFHTHGKWARYVACKGSHMHWLLSIFQQGLTNVIVFSLFLPSLFFLGILSTSLDFQAAPCQLSFLPPPPCFFREAQLRLEHEFKVSREPLS